MTVLGQNRLRMKLYARYVQVCVLYTHDLVDHTVFGTRPGGDRETIRQGIVGDDERMVACGLEGRWQAAKYALPPMRDHGCLAVHGPVGMDDARAEGLGDALVSQAHAEDGYSRGEAIDYGERSAPCGCHSANRGTLRWVNR